MAAGKLPFEEANLPALFRKIAKADYLCPSWFSPGLVDVLSLLLEPVPRKRCDPVVLLLHEQLLVPCQDCVHHSMAGGCLRDVCICLCKILAELLWRMQAHSSRCVTIAHVYYHAEELVPLTGQDLPCRATIARLRQHHWVRQGYVFVDAYPSSQQPLDEAALDLFSSSYIGDVTLVSMPAQKYACSCQC